MPKRILCLVSKHSVSRRKVWHDGLDFRTRCTRCGASLIRLEEGWRAYDVQRDFNPLRNERYHAGDGEPAAAALHSMPSEWPSIDDDHRESHRSSTEADRQMERDR